MTSCFIGTVKLTQCTQEVRGCTATSFNTGINSMISHWSCLASQLLCPCIPLFSPTVNRHPPNSSPPVLFFGSICPSPAPSSSHSLYLPLLITLTLQCNFFSPVVFSHLLSVLLRHTYFCFPVKPGSSSTLKTIPKHLSCPLASIWDYSHTFSTPSPLPSL